MTWNDVTSILKGIFSVIHAQYKPGYNHLIQWQRALEYICHINVTQYKMTYLKRLSSYETLNPINFHYFITESSISLTIRTCQVKIPQGVAGRTTHFYLRDLVCPSPPTRGKKISPEKLDNLIVPRPTSSKYLWLNFQKWTLSYQIILIKRSPSIVCNSTVLNSTSMKLSTWEAQ